MSLSRLLVDRFAFPNLCMKRCIAFLRIQSTVASKESKLFRIEYLRSLRLKTSRRVWARTTGLLFDETPHHESHLSEVPSQVLFSECLF
jgi:hypothetical protein